MAYEIVEFQDTPNPNALKCVLDRPVAPLGGAGLRSYQSRDAAAADPVAVPIMTVPGVVGVLITPGWITISKAPEVEWKQLKGALKKVMSGLE